MPMPAKVPLFNWEEIVTKMGYCAFAGLVGGLGVGTVIAIAGAFPTASLSVIAVPIFAVVGVVGGAAFGFVYGVGSCLWQGMKRAYQKPSIQQVNITTEKLERTNSVSLHQQLGTPSPRKHSDACAEPLNQADLKVRQRRKFTPSMEADPSFFTAQKRRRSEPAAPVVAKENRGCFSRLLSCFN